MEKEKNEKLTKRTASPIYGPSTCKYFSVFIDQEWLSVLRLR